MIRKVPPKGTRASTARKPREPRAFVALAGGGAKGLVHVGALAALEEREVRLRGLAGTSAGALVAALSAAGYSGKDMVNPDRETTILDSIVKFNSAFTSPTAFFGIGGWQKVWWLRRVAKHREFLIRTTVASGLLPLAMVSLSAAHLVSYAVAFWAIVVWTVVLIFAWLVVNSVLGGLANLDDLVVVLNMLLQRKMFPKRPNRIVTFKDFDGERRPALKIVAANLTSGKMTLFCPERTPDASVAEAVGASICLPLIFQLRDLKGELFTDGGIVSNLPAWPFDEERELDPEALTIAIEIANDDPGPKPTRQKWLQALLTTGFFGGSELNLRAAGSTHHITLETSVGLLSFDLAPEEAYRTVREAKTTVGERLDREIFRDPEVYRLTCAAFRTTVVQALRQAPEITGGKGPGHVRVAIAHPDRGRTRSLRLRHGAGFDKDSDYGLLLPVQGSIAGRAWRTHKVQLEQRPFPSEVDLTDETHAHTRRLLRRGLQWVMAIPVSLTDEMSKGPPAVVGGGRNRSSDPLFVVTVDGSYPLADRQRTNEVMGDLAIEGERLFRAVASYLAEEGN